MRAWMCGVKLQHFMLHLAHMAPVVGMQDAAVATTSVSTAGVADGDTAATAGAGSSSPAPPLSSLQHQLAPDLAQEEEEEDDDEEENVGQWSPVPLDPQHIGNQDVVHEDDDQRRIDILRQQVNAEAPYWPAAQSWNLDSRVKIHPACVLKQISCAWCVEKQQSVLQQQQISWLAKVSLSELGTILLSVVNIISEACLLL